MYWDRIETMKKDIRTWFQLAWTALSNGYFKGFFTGSIYKGKLKEFCLPGLNCYSCPGALGSCPIGSLQATLDSGSYKIAFYVLGFLFFFGSVFGRFVCGWLCPFGLAQDLIHKIPLFRKIKNLPGHRCLVWIKYVVLVLFVIILPMTVLNVSGSGQPWFCEYLCPSGMLFGGIPLTAVNAGLRSAARYRFLWKLVLLVGILLLSVKVYRPFCKYLCPLGAIYGLFNPIAFYRFRVVDEKCTRCGACQKVCKMDIPVYLEPNHRECIRCNDCRRACPTGALIRVSLKDHVLEELRPQENMEVPNQTK